ncbi:hypothetical protein BSZ39_03540 [Bowdeniella nasicola]|uniref:Uncharacterized protein n=1 Tax=Bowdeniella nasicola TaxID=208480 RepID=A0A1Q5Q415_9ACTO|nr:hypothetical protein [Bowdeniella nasicola]OKL54541.1 hypothetical protein BSZ39_03540 [Bowdeniella nasicola]
MAVIVSGLAGLDDVLISGGRLFALYWPRLLALFFAGQALRNGVLWLAGKASLVSPTLAVTILPFAPLATLASLALMLRILSPALPAFRELVVGPRRMRWRSNLQASAMALVPFLAVYASNGLLKADLERYRFDQTGVVFSALGQADYLSDSFDRIALPTSGVIVVIVLIALAARKFIAIKKVADASAAWAAVSAYLEALWMTALVYVFTARIEEIKMWVMNRQVVDDIAAWWTTLQDTYSHILAPFRFVGGLISSAGSLIIVPVAWLAIGATIYGAKLAKGDPILTHEIDTKRIQRIPSPVRRAAKHVTSPVVTPVKSTFDAISKVAAAGLIPMALFCVIFTFTGWLRVGVDYLARLAIGPQPTSLQFALDPYVALAENLVYFVTTIVLLAAGVNQVVLSQREREAKAAKEDAANAEAAEAAAQS